MEVEVVGIDGSVRVSKLSSGLDANAATVTELQNGSTSIGPRGAIAVARLSVQDYGPLIAKVLGTDADAVVSVEIDRSADDAVLVVVLPTRVERIRVSDHALDTRSVEVPPTATVGWHSTMGRPGRRSRPSARSSPGRIPGRRSLRRRRASSRCAGRAGFSPDGFQSSELEGPPDEACCEPPMAWASGALYAGVSGPIVTVDATGFTTLQGSDADERTISKRSLGAGEAGVAYLTEIEGAVFGTAPSDEVESAASVFDVVYSPDGATWKRQPLPAGIGNPYCCSFDLFGVVVGAESVAVLAANDTGLEL